MLFLSLTNPADDFTYYGMCPVTHQPVLMGMKEM